MRHITSIGGSISKLEGMRRTLESTQLNALRELLTDKVIAQICNECEYYFRERIFTPLVTIFHMIGAAISREGSFQSSWHNIGQTGNSDTLSKARKRLPVAVWERLHKWITAQIEDDNREVSLWRGHRVIGVDGSCVSMSDEPELQQVFGKSGSRLGKSRFPIARTVFGFDLFNITAVDYKIGSYKTGENRLFSEVMHQFNAGDVIVGDRRFAGAKLYVDYIRAGLHYITRAHQRLKINRLKIRKWLGNNDYIVLMPIPKTYRHKDATLPDNIEVRILKVAAIVRGRKETFWIVTSLLCAEQYPADEIRALYQRRWLVEGLIGEIKIWLGADVLRSKTEEGIRKELCARIIAFNLIRWLILKAAKEHGESAERISFAATVRLIAAFSLKMSTAPFWMLPSLYEELLERIASSIVAYRPGRIEPRMKRRDQKHYPILKISRSEWRALNGIAA
jgi:putative transposase